VHGAPHPGDPLEVHIDRTELEELVKDAKKMASVTDGLTSALQF
jgi:hypothetical protein